jgi:protein O-GlcNAc transferase
MREADVYLDTIGFSGYNTAMQAIECGLPVVAFEGGFLRGRLASGILRRLGLNELVATSESEYVDIAVRLARDAAYWGEMQARLEAARPSLYGDTASVRALEAFFEDALKAA